jgi:hypothetical protein
MPLLRLRLIRPGVFDRCGGRFGFVAQAAFPFGDIGDFLRVLFQRLDAAAFIDDFFAFVEQAFQDHDIPILGAALTPRARRMDEIYARPYPER